MKIKTKISVKILFINVLIVFLFVSCEEMLNTPPEDSQTKEEFWKVKGDVEASVIGAYDAVQGCVWKFFIWGEIRGELLTVVGNSGYDDLKKLNFLNIDQYNSLCKWSEIYSALNRVNTVIKYAPLAQKNDNTFSEKELNEYIGECLTLRALLNFYLARTFYEFPYLTEPSDNDEQEYNSKPIKNEEALDLILTDLILAKDLVKESYDENYFMLKGIKTEDLKTAYRKGRISKPVVWALLTDVYLTKNEFELAVSYADSLINMPGAVLESAGNWHKMFAEGNSLSESIFELQFSTTYKDESTIGSWFVSELSDGQTLFYNTINKSTNTLKYWEGENLLVTTKDRRAINGQYLATDKQIVWKWAGLNLTDKRDKASNDANWIVYRLADVILMKAEAQNRLHKLNDAIETLNIVRKRAFSKPDEITETTENGLEEYILDERAKEFAAEGKRWFDLVRIAKRQNNYAIIGNRIADFRAYLDEQGVWKGKVFDPLSWYLPIHKDELALNKSLEQNPYYTER